MSFIYITRHAELIQAAKPQLIFIMDSPSNCLLSFFFLIATFMLPSLTVPYPTNELGLRLNLTHVDAGKKLTDREFLNRAAARNKVRLALLSRLLSKSAQTPVYWGPIDRFEGEYLIEVGVGTPPRYLSFILDTGSTLVWTQCKPCQSCERQPISLYNPKKSSTFSKLSCSSKQCAALGSTYGSNCSTNSDCHFKYAYADGSETTGYLGTETFTFLYSSNDLPFSVPDFALGCARINQGSMANGTGIAGFGRSKESLISQLGVTRFSYCFIPFIPQNTKRSPLFLGGAATLPRGPVQSTPLIMIENFLVYGVSFEGITVGSTRFAMRPSSFGNKTLSGGLVLFDSGTFNTILVSELFEAVKKEFTSAIKLPVSNYTLSGDYNLCFKTPSRRFSPESIYIPKLVFHFKGADMNLPRENYIVYERKFRLLCVMIEDAQDLRVNIIGNFYQQNMHVVYDLKKEILSFAPAQCDRL